MEPQHENNDAMMEKPVISPTLQIHQEAAFADITAGLDDWTEAGDEGLHQEQISSIFNSPNPGSFVGYGYEDAPHEPDIEYGYGAAPEPNVGYDFSTAPTTVDPALLSNPSYPPPAFPFNQPYSQAFLDYDLSQRPEAVQPFLTVQQSNASSKRKRQVDQDLEDNLPGNSDLHLIKKGKLTSKAELSMKDKEQFVVNPKSKRPKSFNPKRRYVPPPQGLDWVGPLGTNFNYTAEGELDLEFRFEPEQLMEFLTHHKFHHIHGDGIATKDGSGLTLWIQNIPADSSARYPETRSSKCRLTTCPVPNRTIRKGEFRVTIDEWNWHPNVHNFDPYHNAAYIHLYCFEHALDFPYICRNYNVQGDDRKLAEPEERNKMAIIRDYPAMLDIVNKFIDKSIPNGTSGGNIEGWYEHSLCRTLTVYHLQSQPSTRQGVREARGGNSIDKHMNNLHVMVENAQAIAAQKREAAPVKEPNRTTGRKKKAVQKKDDADSEDEDAWTLQTQQQWNQTQNAARISTNYRPKIWET